MADTKPSIWIYCTGIARRCHWWLAGLMLLAMFTLGITSMMHQSAIVDEVAHIPAAYSYIHYGDYRLNPEHPPLMKLLAGIPLQFMHLKFPINQPEWTTQANGEWNVGWDFLYNLGNSAGEILFWARLPILLTAVAFGAFLYRYVFKRFGVWMALLTLFFYTFSPNILANARLVTTDLGVSAFIFIALTTFVRFIEKPTWKNVSLMAFCITLAELSKFSAAMLYPFLALLTIGLIAVKADRKNWVALTKKYLGRYLLACVASAVMIYLVYVPLTWNMSKAVQQNLITGSIPSEPGFAHWLVGISNIPGSKPVVQYGLGLYMNVGRVAGGNVTYFFGNVTDNSFRAYFPAVFLLKTQIAFLILMFASLLGVAYVAWRVRKHVSWPKKREWILSHLVELTMGLFVTAYFAVAIGGNLDLGLRHILPVYPPLFLLVALGTKWLWEKTKSWGNIRGYLLALLLIWYGAATLWIYPNFLSYFNEFIGGPANADSYFSDSSVDWGQSLIQFKQYLADHPEIHTIALDYFGGADPRYYFCKRIYLPNGQLDLNNNEGYDCNGSQIVVWHSTNGRYPGQYIAVSETYLENDRFFAKQVGQPGYSYLRAMKPIAEVGDSIYVYKLY